MIYLYGMETPIEISHGTKLTIISPRYDHNIKSVVSLFDGISCARVALEKSRISVNNYFASEIDTDAMMVSDARWNDPYPNGQEIVYIGDVTKVTGKDYRDTDLLLGGSPCQGLSSAGLRTSFEHHESKLFFEFVRIKNEMKPKNFLFENVGSMSREDKKIISHHLGVEPITIDANLVSAQNRLRHYWTDIPGVTIPKDRHILLPNIAEYNIPRDKKAFVMAGDFLNLSEFRDHDIPRPINFSRVRNAMGKFHRTEGFRTFQGDTSSWENRKFYPRFDLKVNCITSTSHSREHIVLDEDNEFRRLTILELERLQGLPDGYTDRLRLSYTRRFELIGNGWQCDVIAHILSFLKNQYSR